MDIAVTRGRLEGKVALVTGGAQGMGASHVRAIVAEGGRVIIADIDVKLGSLLASELGEKAQFCKLDVTSPDDWNRAVDATLARFGKLNVLVNNAAILVAGQLATFDDRIWDKVLQTNLTGPFLGMQACIEHLSRHGPSSIINVCSTAAFKAYSGFGAYGASKWGLRGLTKTAAVELASSGIRVNSIHPGTVRTPMNDSHVIRFDHVPQQRAAAASEISALVVYLASDESSFSTGCEFIADGGELAGAPA